MADVAAGVIEGKIDDEDSCMAPRSSSAWNVGRRPVRIAGHTTWGVAASMTMSRTFAGTPEVYLTRMRRRSVVRPAHTPHTTAHRAEACRAIFRENRRGRCGSAFAASPVVIWFLERKDDLLVCEIRQAAGTAGYEFEIADATGPKTIHCQ